MQNLRHLHDTITYYQKGNAPKLLILSGMHGDEWETAHYTLEYVNNNYESLPNFLYIPWVSPSAVTHRTRMNSFGHDVNRSFFSPPIDKEALACTEILQKHKFLLCLDFHEDPDTEKEFYLYDSDQMPNEQLERYRNAMKETGITLLNGVDDAADPTLGYDVVDGYVSIMKELSRNDTGFSSGWMLRHHIAKRSLTMEIPGKGDTTLKKTLINALFRFFVPAAT